MGKYVVIEVAREQRNEETSNIKFVKATSADDALRHVAGIEKGQVIHDKSKGNVDWNDEDGVVFEEITTFAKGDEYNEHTVYKSDVDMYIVWCLFFD